MMLNATRLAMAFAIGLFSGSAVAQNTNPLSAELQNTAETIIGGQINAFKSRDHEKAFSYAAPGVRNIFGTTDRFINMVRSGYGAIYGAKTWSFGRAETNGNVVVQEVLITGPQGRDWVALYTLRKQRDGSWRIAGVQMKRGKAQST